MKRASDNADLERQSRQIKSKLQDTHNKLSVAQKALRDTNKQLTAASQQLQQQKAEMHDISISVKKQKRKLNKLREYTNDVRSDLESLLANRNSVDKNELQRINCYADNREEYEASYDYSAYDDEDLEL